MLMRRVTNAALAEFDARFSALYEAVGRPSKVRAVFVFVFAIAAYNIVRLPKLLASTGEACPAA
jgi:hypothetical protein